MREFFCFSMESTDSTQSNKSIRAIPSIKATVGFLLLAAAALGDTHSASVNVTVDTRTTAVTSLAITGPDSVIGGNTATYLCTALYADGSQGDVSSLCTWYIVGTVPAGAQMYGPSLATSSSFSSQTVQIRAAYQRPEGQKISSPFTITITAETAMQAKLRNPRAEGISPGNWEVSAEAAAFGRYGEVQCEWTLDGVVLSGVTGTQLTRHPVSGGVPGSRLLAVRVTDEQNQTATASQLVTFNKPIVPSEKAIVPLVPDPTNGDILDMTGNQFGWNNSLKTNGLIILTHGYTDSGTSDWIQIMGIFIKDRLTREGKPLPNVCIYDWSKVSQPAQVIQDSAEAFKLRNWWNRLNPSAILLSSDAYKFIEGLLLIHDVACSQGRSLAKWIDEQIDAGNIDPAKPIHLIGHSAGGFVVSECAFQLKDKVIVSGDIQYTTLDTPTVAITDKAWFTLSDLAGKSCRMERYDAANGFGILLPFGLPDNPAGYYRRNVSTPTIGYVSAHSYVNTWYTYKTVHPDFSEYDGFYYSPFTDNGFHGVTFAQPAKAFALAADMPISPASEITNSSLTGFETFGSVTLSNGLYQVTEEANAGLFKEIPLPIGAQSVKFNYRFATAGDGDYLVVYWGTNGMPLYIGSDLQLAGSGFMEGEAPVSMFAGETNQLTFMLVSRGETNAVLELKDIALTLSDDPDYDGLTTDEEAALETDPLNSDTDGDGLSDFDEVRTYFTDPLFTDSDEDGMSDSAEIQAGSDPNDPDSCFAVSLTPLPSGGVRLTWQGKSGRHYRVNRCDQLGTGAYTTLATGVSGVEPQTTYDDTQGSSRAFYWVEQEQN